jgi:hypothetical protein
VEAQAGCGLELTVYEKGAAAMATSVEADRIDEEVFDFVRKTEEASVEAGRRFAKAVGDFVPVEMPVLRELMKGVFDFTEGILKVQREFAQKMLRETQGMKDRASKREPEQHRGQRPHRAPSKAA